MTSHVKPRCTPRVLIRGLGAALISVGLALGIFCGYMFWGTNLAGDQASAQILELASEEFDESALIDEPSVAVPDLDSLTVASSGGLAAPSVEPLPDHGDLLAVVSIPSIDVEVPVLEGTDAEVLDQGVLGHYPGTASAGTVGNFALAGHRTTHGAPLYDIDEIVAGDAIVVQTRQGWDVYTMQRRRIVDPDAVEVIAPVPDDPGADPTSSWMVLTSCHPKVSAAKRIIAYASLDRHVPKDQGPPAELG